MFKFKPIPNIGIYLSSFSPSLLWSSGVDKEMQEAEAK